MVSTNELNSMNFNEKIDRFHHTCMFVSSIEFLAMYTLYTDMLILTARFVQAHTPTNNLLTPSKILKIHGVSINIVILHLITSWYLLHFIVFKQHIVSI